MSLSFTKILGITVTTAPKKEVLEYISEYLAANPKSQIPNPKQNRKPLVVFTPNSEQIVYAQGDHQFARILGEADIAIPDGIGVVAAMRLLASSQFTVHSSQLPARIAGIEFMGDLIKMAAKQGYKIALIGGRGGVAVKALECLQLKHPSLKGWAEDGPELTVHSAQYTVHNRNKKEPNSFQQFNNLTMKQFGDGALQQYLKQTVEKIRTSGSRLVFVGLGAPKQEYFIEALSRQLSAISRYNQTEGGKLQAESCVMMSVGGAFDMIAGRIPRAPLLIRNIGLEWLWRLIRQPWRFKRQLTLLEFVFLVVKEKLKLMREV